MVKNNPKGVIRKRRVVLVYKDNHKQIASMYNGDNVVPTYFHIIKITRFKLK